MEAVFGLPEKVDILPSALDGFLGKTNPIFGVFFEITDGNFRHMQTHVHDSERARPSQNQGGQIRENMDQEITNQKYAGTLRGQMLESLLIERAVASTDLMTMCISGIRSAQYAVKSLRDRGFLTELKRTVYDKDGGMKTYTLCYITPTGLRWLVETAKDDEEKLISTDGAYQKCKTTMPWLKYMDCDDLTTLSVLGEIGGRYRETASPSEESALAIFASAASGLL